MRNGRQRLRDDPQFASLIKLAREQLLRFANADWITRFPHFVEGVEDDLRGTHAASAIPRDNVTSQTNIDSSDNGGMHVGSTLSHQSSVLL